MLSFIFAGEDSFIDYGLIIAKRPALSSPKRRVSYVDIPGRDSNLRFNDATYEDITIIADCSVKSIDNLPLKLDSIKSWLFNAGESDLIFSFQPDKKYIAQVVNAIDFKQVFKYTSQFPIVFNCRPFKYAVQNKLLIITKSGTVITNPGSFKSEPIVSIYGSGNIILKISSEQINFNNINGKIIVDSIIKDCYDDTGNNLNSRMSGEFLKLSPGENIIQWVGNVTKIEILPNWRWL